MKFLAILLGFGGYMLVYAAVANSGAFATEPWRGLFEDAYGTTTPKKQPTAPSAGGPFSPPGSPNNANPRPGRTRSFPVPSVGSAKNQG